MKVHIIGGGVVGLCTAYYLNNAGCEVHVVDPSDLSDGTSHGNAGMIVPSHFIPLAAPGVMAKGLKWMFKSSSPFYIKPKLDFRLAQWLWRFYKSCSEENVIQAAPILYEFNRLSAQLYQDISVKEKLDFSLESKGLLMMYQTQKMEKEEVEMAEMANEIGIEAKQLSESDLSKLEKDISVNARGAVYFPGDSHLLPNEFIAQMIQLLKNSGVVFHRNRVKNFDHSNGKITSVICDDGKKHITDEVVLAAGSWTAQLLEKLKGKMLLQNGKGYSFTFKNQQTISPSIPTILSEAKVAVTPMGEYLRVGGTLEVCGHDDKFHVGRMRGIKDSMANYYPEFPKGNDSAWDKSEAWLGYRPCTPDGLPYIGRVNGFSNLVVSTGHGMMGMSMGPATGLLTSQIITKKELCIKTELFNPNRF